MVKFSVFYSSVKYIFFNFAWFCLVYVSGVHPRKHIKYDV